MDLKKKKPLREKFNVKDEMVLPYEPVNYAFSWFNFSESWFAANSPYDYTFSRSKACDFLTNLNFSISELGCSQCYINRISCWIQFLQIPVLKIPEYGEMAAVHVCQKMKIESQNDRDKLAEAKKEVYLKGFYDGVSIWHVILYLCNTPNHT